MVGQDEWHTTFRLFTPEGEEMITKQRPLARALREGRPIGGVEALAATPNGSLTPVLCFPRPLYDEKGELLGAVSIFVDMTERKEAEDMFRLAVEAAPSAMVLIDQHGHIMLVNSEAEQLFGYGRTELVGRPVEMLIPPRLRTGHAAFRESYGRNPGRRTLGAERNLFALCKDGSEVPVEIGLNAIRTKHGMLVLAAVVDLTERQRVAEREKLLVRELRHRSNNIFAIVQAIVSRTLASDLSVQQAREALRGRLQAMARTHDVTGETPGGGLSLSSIIRAELEPFAEQVEIAGPDVLIAAQQAQNISLALHELATNASKYGALSTPSGK